MKILYCQNAHVSSRRSLAPPPLVLRSILIEFTENGIRGKVELLKSYGIPVWVMEPVRGGELAKMSEEEMEKMSAFRPGVSPAEWAFRFVQSIPEAAVILSGMSDMRQMEENIRIFCEEKPLTGAEWDALLQIARARTEKTMVPCTACRYCMDYCPQKLMIPYLLEMYNELCYTQDPDSIKFSYAELGDDQKPGACIGCGACAAVCPQRIDIPGAMADFAGRMK